MAKRSSRNGSVSRSRAVGAIVVAALWLAAAPAGAVSISLAPAAVSPAPGGTFALDLVVSGIGEAGSASALGAFDVALAFDPGAVAFSSATFDVLLGEIPAEASAEHLAGVGTLSLAEFSTLDTSALEALQDDSFRLATIVFESLGAAPSTIAITSVLLGDGAGVRILLSAPPGGTSVTPIPEPAAALLFAIGVGVAARAARERRA